MTSPDEKPILRLTGSEQDPAALGRVMLRLASHAAAVHRFETAMQHHTGGATALEWRGLRLTDSTGHGRPATSPLARLGGSEATEGDR